MTFTLDMTLLAILALIAGVAAFVAPRFLGVMVGIGLIVFAIFQLFPGISDIDIANALSEIDLGDINIEETRPETVPNEAG